MLFCTLNFFGFFALVFAIYWALPWQRARIWLLLLASFFFYASWNHWLACLVFATTALDFVLARRMGATRSQRLRRGLLLLSLAVNLGLLIYLKYANFFLATLSDALRAAGASASFPLLQVILPIGISFYTFEAINYMVDVYRGKMPAERDFSHFLLFILFFPHLIAGPIVRAHDFLPQIRRSKRWSWLRLHVGGRYILLGMFKKMVLADHMARLVDPVFAAPTAFGTGVLWMAVVAYAMQVYCDFSGYSDLAVGTARLLGYRLAQNFNLPYLASNIADVWRRWHMSLSFWFRDYVFFPLGGSRGPYWITSRNLLLTMTLCGLWHGANWTFVAWGALQGIYLVVHRGFRLLRGNVPVLERAFNTGPACVMSWALTQTCFVTSWVLFRTSSLSDGAAMLQNMVLPHAGQACPIPVTCFWQALGVMVVGHAFGYRERWKAILNWAPAPIRGLAFASMLVVCLIFAPVTTQLFIYFQF